MEFNIVKSSKDHGEERMGRAAPIFSNLEPFPLVSLMFSVPKPQNFRPAAP